MTRSEAGQNSPDLRSIAESEWPTGVFPLGDRQRRTEPQIAIRSSVWNAIHHHGLSNPDVEVCGVLVGQVLQDISGPFVYVEASIAGEHAAQQLAQVTFTAETWEAIHATLERDYPDRRILGWYHTHPGFGIFLSSMDLFIHRNFFGNPEQLAIVFDPVSGDEGAFVWRRGEPVREAILVEVDEPITNTPRPRQGDQADRSPVRTPNWRWARLLLALLILAAFAATVHRFDLANRLSALWRVPAESAEAIDVSPANEDSSR